MFISVKNLTALIDERINYVNEGIESRNNFDSETFNNYIVSMTSKLNNSIIILKQISSNKKLIEKYENKVNETLKQMKK